MATAWRKVKREHDLSFTIQDMLKVYYGNQDSVKRFKSRLKELTCRKMPKTVTGKIAKIN